MESKVRMGASAQRSLASTATLHRRSSPMLLASIALRSSASSTFSLLTRSICRFDAKPFSDLLVSVLERGFRAYNAEKEERGAELRERLMQYRILKRETTDPIAIGFLHDIVSELEGDLDGMDE